MRIIKIVIVIINKFKVLLIFKKVDDTIAGIISKTTKGFVTPPVRNNKKDS